MHRLALRALVVAAGLWVSTAPLVAQNVPDRASAVEYRKQFLTDLDTLQSKVVALANAVPADKYSWRPAEGVRSFGEVFMHIASEHYIFTPMSFGAPRSPVIPRGQDEFKKFEANSSKDSVLKYLNDGFAYTKASLAAIPDDSLVGQRKLFGRDFTVMETGIGMTADLHEHLGQLIAYARMNGITPPWSK
jgi:hypothetical protein